MSPDQYQLFFFNHFYTFSAQPLPEHRDDYTTLHIPAEVWPAGAQGAALRASCMQKLSGETGWHRSGHRALKGVIQRSPCPFTCTEAPQDSNPTTISNSLTVLLKNLRQWKQHKTTLHNILVPDVLVSFCAQVYKNTLKGSVKDLVFLRLGSVPAFPNAASLPPRH